MICPPCAETADLAAATTAIPEHAASVCRDAAIHRTAAPANTDSADR